MADSVERAIAALRAGAPVLLPTDTVYGLTAAAVREEPTHRLYRLKGREITQPTALLAGSIAKLFECVPELREHGREVVEALLPGPFTLVLPNPARRFRWINGLRTDAIGVRVPVLPEPAQAVLDVVGAVVATSANDPGGPNARRLDDVPQRIRDGCGAEVDVGELPGTPSTVLDFTGPEPHVIREGAAPAAEAFARVRAARAG
jgi:L-threonylcarbamoyladenylate synthase